MIHLPLGKVKELSHFLGKDVVGTNSQLGKFTWLELIKDGEDAYYKLKKN